MSFSPLALVDQLRQLPAEICEQVLRDITAEEGAWVAFAWRDVWARPDQLSPPGRWRHWLLVGGRGAGKSTSLVQWIIERARAGLGPIRLIGGTISDVHTTLIHDEQTGILALSPPDFMPQWDPSYDKGNGQLTWPNGVVARIYSAEKPRRLRGKQSRTDAFDDLAGMGPRAKEVWDMAQLGNRIWGDCRSAYTTTPENVELIVHLMEGDVGGIVRTYSRQAANVGNLTAGFVSAMEEQYGGTEMGAQELDGVLIKHSRSSPFFGVDFNAPPVRVAVVDLRRVALIAIGIDPAEGAGEDNDEWGIVPVALLDDGHMVTLEDLSALLTDGDEEEPGAGDVIVDAAIRWQTSCPQARLVLVAENNRGEQRVRTVINAASYRARLQAERGAEPPPLPEIVGVKAKEGKIVRAGELRPLLTKGMLHHLPGLVKLEAQAHALKPNARRQRRQDDHIDAEVHAVTYLADLSGDYTGASDAGLRGVVSGRYAGVMGDRGGGRGRR